MNSKTLALLWGTLAVIDGIEAGAALRQRRYLRAFTGVVLGSIAASLCAQHVGNVIEESSPFNPANQGNDRGFTFDGLDEADEDEPVEVSS